MILATSQVASASTFTYYTVAKDDGTANHVTTPQSFLWGLPCSVSFTEYASIGTATPPYTAAFDWYAPDGNPLLSFPASYISNLTCANIGTASTSVGINNSYTAKTTMTTSAVGSHDTWVLNQYQCDIPSNNIMTLEVNGTTPFDYNGYFPYDYQRTFTCYGSGGCSLPTQSSMVNTIISDLNSLHYGIVNTPKSCSISSGITQSTTRVTTSPALGTNRMADWQIINIHNYYTTKINISVLSSSFSAYCAGIGSCTCNSGTGNAVWLYDPVLGVATQLSASVPYTTIYTVSRNQDYWLLIEGECGVGTGSFGSTITFNYPRFNTSINAYQANLNCSAWTSCINNQQTRYCTDLNGIIAPYIDQRSCTIFGPEQSVLLGFDTQGELQGYTNYTWQAAYGYFCSVGAVNTRARTYPSGWSVHQLWGCDNYSYSPEICGYVDDLMDLQQDSDVTGQGGRSLKMWYIPPAPFQPVYNVTPAGKIVNIAHTTEGKTGFLERHDLNSTFYISKNITAYSPYMSLYFKTKSCDVIEWGLGTCWPLYNIVTYFTYDGLIATPKPKIRVQFVDTITGLPVVDETYRPANTLFKDGAIDKQLSGLIFNRTYQLSFSVEPDSGLYDPDSYCVKLDDVRVNFRSVAPNCTSQCVDDVDNNGVNDYTFVTSTQRTTTECDLSYSAFSPDCVPAAIRPCAISKTSQGCCVGTTLYTWINSSQSWTALPNSDYCFQLQEQEEQQRNLSGTNPLIKSLLNAMGISDADVDNSGFAFALSTIFIVFMINLAIGGFLMVKTKTWEAGALVISGLCLIESIPPWNIFPAWFSILFIIFIGLFVAEFANKRIKGGAGH
jgi:hypothetical protein